MNENQICVVCTLSKLPLNFVIFSVGSTHFKGILLTVLCIDLDQLHAMCQEHRPH